MSAVIAASPSVNEPVKTTSTARLKSYLLYTLFASLYILPFMRLYMLGTDEGILDNGAVRIIHGQVFARDFFEVIGPGTFYWLAAFFRLFGVSFVATRICLFITSLGTALLMYFLSRRICTRYRILPCLILAGTYFSGLWPAISHHVDSNFFALLVVALMVFWRDKRSSSLLIAAGASAGLTTAFLQPKGILLFCALLIWLWVLYRRGSTSPYSFGAVTVGYLSTIGLVLLYFWSNRALGSLLYVNVVWPTQHYWGVNSVPYAYSFVSNFWNHFVIAKSGYGWTMLIGIVLITPVFLVAALPVLLPVLGARCRWGVASPEVLLYWLCGGAMWLAELHRKDMTHLIFGSPLLIILCVYFLAEYREAVVGSALQLLSISAVCLAGFNLLVTLLAAHPIITRVGTIYTFRELPGLKYLETHTNRGDEIFAYPYCPRYYFLSDTTNPTPYFILTYNYNTPSQFQEVVRILDERKVRYVVWDTNLDQVKPAVFPGSTRIPPGGLVVEPYLESHYQDVEVVGGVRIMERKSDDNAN